MSDDASGPVIRGWGCTPTGDPPPAAAQNSKPRCTSIFTRGWRRTALFSILAFLMLLVFLNIALTLWIISTLKLNARGIGPIKIVKGGIQLDGQAWVMEKLVASTISSLPAQPIVMHAYRNFSVLVSKPDQEEKSKLVIKRDNIECSGQVFEVRDARGESVFRASRDEVQIRAESLTVRGAGGAVVPRAVQTPLVRAPHGSDLQLESLTRRLDLRAPQSITLESRAGGIDITSHNDIKLDSLVGAIQIDSPNIVIKNLKEAIVTDKPVPSGKYGKIKRVYQLCACASGKLFLAAPDALCATHADDTELCR